MNISKTGNVGRTVTTTVPSIGQPGPMDQVNRQCEVHRPNALWVSDLPCVATGQGYVYVTFVVAAERAAGPTVAEICSSCSPGFSLPA